MTRAPAPWPPAAPALRHQIDHVRASILGIEDAVRIRTEREAAGKKTDNLNAFRKLRLAGLREVLDTLEGLLAAVEQGRVA